MNQKRLLILLSLTSKISNTVPAARRQTPLRFTHLVEPPYKTAVINNLVNDIKTHNYKLTAGEVGYKYLLGVLEDVGQ